LRGKAGDLLKKDKTVEISVKTVFTGKRSAEQAFVDLIRQRKPGKSANNLELFTKTVYNGNNFDSVVFPDIHAPERGICYE
jgi:hypothetical protein